MKVPACIKVKKPAPFGNYPKSIPMMLILFVLSCIVAGIALVAVLKLKPLCYADTNFFSDHMDNCSRWMRDHPKCSVLPTMMFSTSDDERDVQLAYDLGANAYFVKPALVSELKAILQTAYEFWARCVKPKARSG